MNIQSDGVPKPVYVSILLTTHNGAPTLSSQLEALAAEMGPDAELVLVDDASTDDTVAIAQAHLPYLRMTVLTHAISRGKATALQRALSVSVGEAILIVDQDDIIGEKYVSSMVSALRSHPFVSARLEYALLNADWLREALQGMPDQDGAHVRFRSSVEHEDMRVMVAPGCALGIRRSLLEAVGGFAADVSCADDLDLCIRARLLGITYKRVEAALLHYRFRDRTSALCRQRFRYGEAWVALYKKHRGIGMQRRRFSQLANELRRMVAGSMGSRASRIRAIATLAFFCGRIYGCLTLRVLYF